MDAVKEDMHVMGETKETESVWDDGCWRWIYSPGKKERKGEKEVCECNKGRYASNECD